MVVQWIATLLIKKEVFSFRLLIGIILINDLNDAIEPAEPSWDAVLEID